MNRPPPVLSMRKSLLTMTRHTRHKPDCSRSAMSLIIVACVLLLAPPAHARDIKVRTYRELRDACTQARPGDIITLAPGVYRITGASRISIDKRPGPITVRGATGKAGDVIIEGAGQDNPTVPMVFDLTDSPRWTFENFTTRSTYYHGFKFNGASTDCLVRRVVMRDHGEGGIKGTFRTDAQPDRLRVENCDIGWSRATGGTRDVVEGIDGVAGNDWVITGCRFVNVQKGGNPAYGVFTKGNASNTVIERSRFENCFIGASFGGGGTGPAFFRDGDRQFEHRGGIIRNNVFVRCTDAAIYLNKARDAKIYHNTLFGCALTIQLRYPESSARVCNNLVLPASGASDEPIVRVRDGATLLQNAGNLTAKATDFIRTSGWDIAIDVRLATGASAIDAGTNVIPDGANDFAGHVRPAGKAPDVGAFEQMLRLPLRRKQK